MLVWPKRFDVMLKRGWPNLGAGRAKRAAKPHGDCKLGLGPAIRLRAKPWISARLDQPHGPKAGIAFLADDHVIMQRDPHCIQSLFNLAGHGDIGIRRGRVA